MKNKKHRIIKIVRLNSEFKGNCTKIKNDPNKKIISLREDSIHFKTLVKKWRIESSNMTLKKLPVFLNHIINDYNHDYGTTCHALAVGAVATMWALNNESGTKGGITGFQAGAVMWETIMNWQSHLRGKPLRLMDYSNMIYPQYEYKFEKTISPNIWNTIRVEAKRALDGMKPGNGHPDVISHMESIIAGIVPFGYKVEEN
jgi:hypothetical protein